MPALVCAGRHALCPEGVGGQGQGLQVKVGGQGAAAERNPQGGWSGQGRKKARGQGQVGGEDQVTKTGRPWKEKKADGVASQRRPLG